MIAGARESIERRSLSQNVFRSVSIKHGTIVNNLGYVLGKRSTAGCEAHSSAAKNCEMALVFVHPRIANLFISQQFRAGRGLARLNNTGTSIHLEETVGPDIRPQNMCANNHEIRTRKS